MISDEEQLEHTIALMRSAHSGHFDKQGKPYWMHPMAVMEGLGPDATLDEKLTALLHDIVEDTELSISTLTYLGYKDTVVNAVALLTRPKDVDYFTYIDWIARSGNKLAIKVKHSDLDHNMHPERPIPDTLMERYRRAKAMLPPV